MPGKTKEKMFKKKDTDIIPQKSIEKRKVLAKKALEKVRQKLIHVHDSSEEEQKFKDLLETIERFAHKVKYSIDDPGFRNCVVRNQDPELSMLKFAFREIRGSGEINSLYNDEEILEDEVFYKGDVPEDNSPETESKLEKVLEKYVKEEMDQIEP